MVENIHQMEKARARSDLMEMVKGLFQVTWKIS